MEKIRELTQIIWKKLKYHLQCFRTTFKRRNVISSARYNKHLDQIDVHIEDCSFSEVYCGRRIALLEKNYDYFRRYVGFSLYGVRHFIITYQLPMSGEQRVKDILNKMVEKCPAEEFPRERLAVIRKISAKHAFEVYIPEPVKR